MNYKYDEKIIIVNMIIISWFLVHFCVLEVIAREFL